MTQKLELVMPKSQLSLFLKLASNNRKLIGLSKNILNGNSLISDNGVDHRAFDWNQKFPNIFYDPKLKEQEKELKLNQEIQDGFDIVIGNPPYIRQELFKEIKPYLKTKFDCYNSIADLYVYFVEKGISLLKENGVLSFILPNKFMKTGYGKEIRSYLKDNTKLKTIYDFDDYPVFVDATTYPIIMILEKSKDLTNYEFLSSTLKNNDTKIPILELIKNEHSISSNVITSTPWQLSDSETSKIMEKINENTISLDNFVSEKIFYGMKTGRNNIFIINEDEKSNLIKEESAKDIIKKVVTGKEVKRYRIDFDEKYVLFLPWNYDLEHSQSIKEYLLKHRSELEKRAEVKSSRHNWWALTRYGSENSHLLSEPKIVYPCISQKSNFCLDESGELFLTNNNFFISSSSKSLLAVLNSDLISFFLKQKCPSLRGGYHDFRREFVKQTPIHNSILTNDKILAEYASKILEYNKEYLKEEESFWSRINSNFEPTKINQKMNSFTELNFHEFEEELKKYSSKYPNDPDKQEIWEKYFDKKKSKFLDLKNKIEIIDKEINDLVYKIYGISTGQQSFIKNYLNSF